MAVTTIAEWLQRQAHKRRLPLYIVAERAGVSSGFIYRVAKGKRKIRPKTLETVARAGLGITDEALIREGMLIAAGYEPFKLQERR